MANIRMLSARRELVEKEKLKDQGTIKARRNQESDTQDVAKKTNTSESERTAKKANTDSILAESEEKIATSKKRTAAIGATIGAVGALVGFAMTIGKAIGSSKKPEDDDENEDKPVPEKQSFLDKILSAIGLGKKEGGDGKGEEDKNKPIAKGGDDKKPVAEKQSFLDKVLSAVGLKKEDKVKNNEDGDKPIAKGGDDKKPVEEKQSFLDKVLSAVGLKKGDKVKNNEDGDKPIAKGEDDKEPVEEKKGFLDKILSTVGLEQKEGKVEKTPEEKKKAKDDQATYTQLFKTLLSLGTNNSVESKSDVKINKTKGIEGVFDKIDDRLGDLEAAIEDIKNNKSGTADSALSKRFNEKLQLAVEKDNPTIVNTLKSSESEVKDLKARKEANTSDADLLARASDPSTTTPFNENEVAKLKELGVMDESGAINQTGLTKATEDNKKEGTGIDKDLTSAQSRVKLSQGLLNSIKEDRKSSGDLDGSKAKTGGLNSEFLQSLASIIGLDLKDISKSPEKVQDKKAKNYLKEKGIKEDSVEGKEFLQSIQSPEKFSKNQDIKKLAEKYGIKPEQMDKYFETDDKGNVSLKKGEGKGVFASIKNSFESESNIVSDIKKPGGFLGGDKSKTAEFLKELDSSIQGGLSGNILNDLGSDAKAILDVDSSSPNDSLIKDVTQTDGKSIDKNKLDELKVKDPDKYNQTLSALGLNPNSNLTQEALDNGLKNSGRVIDNPTFAGMLQSAGLGKNQTKKMIQGSGRDDSQKNMENGVGGAKGQGEGQRGNWFNMMVLGLNASMPAIQFMLQQLDKMREAEDQLNEARAKKSAANALLAKLGADLKRTQGSINGDAKDLSAGSK